MVDSSALLEHCAPEVPARLMDALVRVESSWRPTAIGMDAGELPVRQPQTMTQAVAQAKALASAGLQFSVGLAQIHVSNVARYGMSWEQAFDPCLNLEAGQRVLQGFYRHAQMAGYVGMAATHAALRGYNAGAIDRAASASYARRVVAYAQGGPSGLRANVQASTAESPMPLDSGLPRGVSSSHAEPSALSLSRSEAAEIFAKKSTIAGF